MLSPSLIASTGHASAQEPQERHASVILYALLFHLRKPDFTQGNPVRSYYSRFPCEMQVVFHGKQKTFFQRIAQIQWR